MVHFTLIQPVFFIKCQSKLIQIYCTNYKLYQISLLVWQKISVNMVKFKLLWFKTSKIK